MLMIEMPPFGGFASFDEARKDPRATADARRAIDTFESLLGRGWPGPRGNRPLALRFFVAFQRCLTIEGVRLAHLIEEVSPWVEPRCLRSLVRRLLGSSDYSDYIAGDTALSFMASVLQRGRIIRPIPEGNEPTADIEIVLDGRPVTVEFKTMRPSADDNLAWDFLQAIADAGVDLNSVAGEISVVPARESHAAIAAEVAARLANERDEVVSVCGGWIRRRPERIPPRGPSDTVVVGPSVKTDRDRLLDRIRNHGYVRQLERVSGPTVLLVRSQTAILGADNDLIGWSDALASVLSRTRRLGAVIVVEDGGVRPGYYVAGPFRFLVDNDPDDRVPRSVLLVSNENADWRLTSAEMDALVGPTMVW